MRHHPPRAADAGTGSVPIPEGCERCYTPRELALWLQVDESSIRRWFNGRPGVLRLGAGKYSTIRIPLSVLRVFVEERSR